MKTKRLLATAVALWVAALPALANDNGLRESFADVPAADLPIRLVSVTPPERLDADRPTARFGAGWGRVAPGANVFGSVTVPMSSIAIAPRWRAVLDERADAFFDRDCAAANAPAICRSAGWNRWVSLRDRVRGLRGRELLTAVNRSVNAMIAYRSDERLYRRADHWASLAEIVARGAGDCEDYAIAKMWVLRAAGVPSESMQITVLRDTRRGLDHAVLAVHVDGEMLILDNVHDRVLADARVRDYAPLFTVASTGSFVHGRRVAPQPVRVAGARTGDGAPN